MASSKKSSGKNGGTLRYNPDEFLNLVAPAVPPLLDNVLLAFSKNIPEDAKQHCELHTGEKYSTTRSDRDQKNHLKKFVEEQLDAIARLEYAFWLNGRLPFITPRELLIWRLRQYVEHIWAFQLPDDDDLALIFNVTKLRAAHFASDFIARFRKALLLPLALRRVYRLLRGDDEHYKVLDPNYEYKKSLGALFKIPSLRYVQDANTLIDEFRLRVEGVQVLRDAVAVDKEEGLMWVSHDVVDVAKDDAIRTELLDLYKVPHDSGYEG